jgi:nucleoside-diphosphate-sugar epimerase
MTLSSAQHPVPLHKLAALQPSWCTMLRIAVDAGSVLVGFLFAWFVVAGEDIDALADQCHSHYVLPILLLSLSTPIAYAAAGLYVSAGHRRLGVKLPRVALVNFALLAVSGAFVLSSGDSTPLALEMLAATVVVSASLASLARVFSVVLRSDHERRSKAEAREASDERKVLVIGGAGYIGSVLVERLLMQGFRVTVLDALHFGEDTLARVAGHPDFTLIREDFRHIEVVTRAMSGVGSVVHLGGLVGDPACAVDPSITVDVNVTATRVIGEIAKACGVRRFVFASSCSVYGACDEIVDENSSFNPQSLYARSKVASEAVLFGLNSSDFAVTCLRFATIYGISGRTRFDLVVNLLCAKAVRDGVITVFGADQWRPFVHVEDVARAIAITLAAPSDVVAGQALNVGSDSQNYTLGQVAVLIQTQVPDARIVADDTFVDRRNYRVSFKKIRTVLGFEPAWTLERGIAQVNALVRTNQVGHYSLPAYSNLLYLKEHGTNCFANFKITGWENDMMSIDRLVPGMTINHSAAA